MLALSRTWLRAAFAVALAAALHFSAGTGGAAVDDGRAPAPVVQSAEAGAGEAGAVTPEPVEMDRIQLAQARKGDGAYCTSALECASQKCLVNVCGGPKKVNGSQCTSAFECASQNCTLNICGGPRRPNGSVCTSALECASQRCLNRICR